MLIWILTNENVLRLFTEVANTIVKISHSLYRLLGLQIDIHCMFVVYKPIRVYTNTYMHMRISARVKMFTLRLFPRIILLHFS